MIWNAGFVSPALKASSQRYHNISPQRYTDLLLGRVAFNVLRVADASAASAKTKQALKNFIGGARSALWIRPGATADGVKRPLLHMPGSRKKKGGASTAVNPDEGDESTKKQRKVDRKSESELQVMRHTRTRTCV
jgi:hypothetical protein